MKRHLGKLAPRIIFFLLLGAVLNIAVAWACVMWPTSVNGGIRGITAAETSWLQAHGEQPSKMARGWLEESTGLGFRHRSIRLYDAQFEADLQAELDADMKSGGGEKFYRMPQWYVHSQEAGWPFKCLTYDLWIHTPNWITANRYLLRGKFSIQDRKGILIEGGVQFPSGRFLPIRPIVWPFAFDSVIYGAFIYLMTRIVRLVWNARSLIRTKRGLCPACAYPIGISPVCTECGKPVTPSPPQRAVGGEGRAAYTVDR